MPPDDGHEHQDLSKHRTSPPFAYDNMSATDHYYVHSREFHCEYPAAHPLIYHHCYNVLLPWDCNAIKSPMPSTQHVCGARTTEMMTPKTQDLIIDVTTSHAVTARAAELRITFAGTSYTSCARSTLAAKPEPQGVRSKTFKCCGSVRLGS